jgi:hypothetical protein
MPIRVRRSRARLGEALGAAPAPEHSGEAVLVGLAAEHVEPVGVVEVSGEHGGLLSCPSCWTNAPYDFKFC